MRSLLDARQWEQKYLEEEEFEPMFASCESKLSGKRIALFGSYGWGDGEWMMRLGDKMQRGGSCLDL